MAEMLYGGGGYFAAFRLKTNAGATAYEIMQADGTTAATTAAHASLIVEGYLEQSQLQPQSDGTMKITLDNYDVAEAITEALNTVAKKPNTSAGTAPAGVFMEHGIEKGGSAGSTVPTLLYTSAGPINEAATKRLSIYGVAKADMSSGPIIYKNGQWIKPTITLNGMASEYALPITPAALWKSTYWDTVTIGTVTIPQYSNYEREWLVKQV